MVLQLPDCGAMPRPRVDVEGDRQRNCCESVWSWDLYGVLDIECLSPPVENEVAILVVSSIWSIEDDNGIDDIDNEEAGSDIDAAVVRDIVGEHNVGKTEVEDRALYDAVCLDLSLLVGGEEEEHRDDGSVKVDAEKNDDRSRGVGEVESVQPYDQFVDCMV